MIDNLLLCIYTLASASEISPARGISFCRKENFRLPGLRAGIQIYIFFISSPYTCGMKTGYVYILASKENGTLYIGVTSDLKKRIWEHRTSAVEGFTSKYKVHTLVYYEQTENIESAIAREKNLKNWQRKWKLELVNRFNPEWKDLYEEL